MIPLLKAAPDSGTEAVVEMKTDLIRRMNVKRFALLVSDSSFVLVVFAGKGSRPIIHLLKIFEW